MKSKTGHKNHGAGMSKVPFYCDPIISCLDLTTQSIKKLEGFPEIVDHDATLKGQLCFDLALTILDRIEENHRALSITIDAAERRLWESNSPMVSSAYKELDARISDDEKAQINEAKARAYCAIFTPNSVLSQDSEFQSLLKSVIPSMDIEGGGNAARIVESKATSTRDNTVHLLCIERDNLSKSKELECTEIREKVYGKMCGLAIDSRESLFDFSMDNMCRLSDATQRLVTLKNCRWITDFWTKIQSLTRSKKGFSIESFALRRLQSAQFILDSELGKNDKKTIAKRPDIFGEWALKHGCRWGISIKKFDYNAQYNKLKAQDMRVNEFFMNIGFGDVKNYLGADKGAPYLQLESHLASSLVKTENDYSILANQLRAKAISGANVPTLINLCPDIGLMFNEKENGPILHLENTIGPIFDSQSSLIRKIARMSRIRLK